VGCHGIAEVLSSVSPFKKRLGIPGVDNGSFFLFGCLISSYCSERGCMMYNSVFMFDKDVLFLSHF
jgi:hypothetical protein